MDLKQGVRAEAMSKRILRVAAKVLLGVVIAVASISAGRAYSMKIIGICRNGGVEALESGSVSPSPTRGAEFLCEDVPAVFDGETPVSVLQSLSRPLSQFGAGR